MSALLRPQSIADLPAQHATNPSSKAENRARYFNTGNAFNVILPPVPNAVFADEPARAMDDDQPTGFIACDASAEMQCDFEATSPLLLASYATIRAGELLEANYKATGVVHYVMRGSGTLETGGESLEWSAGDVFVTPGGVTHQYRAGDATAVIWVVTNEPHLRFEHLNPPGAGKAPTGVVHYPSDEITAQIAIIDDVGRDAAAAGSALIFSSDQQESARNVLPTVTLAMNSLPANTVQRPHRHNAVAISLVIRGDRCHSMIDGQRKDWAPWATTITPPVSVHSHHNEGDEQALFLIVQDGGLFYHARAMGFEFVDE